MLWRWVVPQRRELLEVVDVHERRRRADGLHAQMVAVEVALDHRRLVGFVLGVGLVWGVGVEARVGVVTLSP